MAGTATVQLVATVTGLLAGDRNYNPADNTSVTSPGVTELVTLSSGANTLTKPSGATFLLIIPPTSNTTITLKLKGVTGDTGVTIRKAQWTLLGLDDATVVITASGSLAGVELVWI
jgi:hypothetical protein